MEAHLPIIETQRMKNTDEVCSLISWKVINFLLPEKYTASPPTLPSPLAINSLHESRLLEN